ncbi:Unknown protein, partial [Striga hermonthica]
HLRRFLFVQQPFARSSAASQQQLLHKPISAPTTLSPGEFYSSHASLDDHLLRPPSEPCCEFPATVFHLRVFPYCPEAPLMVVVRHFVRETPLMHARAERREVNCSGRPLTRTGKRIKLRTEYQGDSPIEEDDSDVDVLNFLILGDKESLEEEGNDTGLVIEPVEYEEWSGITNRRIGGRRASGGDARAMGVHGRAKETHTGGVRNLAGEGMAGARQHAREKVGWKGARKIARGCGAGAGVLHREGIGVLGAYARKGGSEEIARMMAHAWWAYARSLVRAGLGEREAVHAPTFNARPPGPVVRRLSPEEVKRRREKGLCFKYEEKFTPGHQCKQAFVIEVANTDEEGSEVEEEPHQEDEVE